MALEVFNCIWLEAGNDHSGDFEGFIDAFGEMEVSFVLWTSEGGDVCFEIDIADQSMAEPVCSVLRNFKVISKEEADEIINAKISVITLY
jgi:hypothetical protein